MSANREPRNLSEAQIESLMLPAETFDALFPEPPVQPEPPITEREKAEAAYLLRIQYPL